MHKYINVIYYTAFCWCSQEIYNNFVLNLSIQSRISYIMQNIGIKNPLLMYIYTKRGNFYCFFKLVQNEQSLNLLYFKLIAKCNRGSPISVKELVVNCAYSLVGVGSVDEHGNLDFACAYHLNVNLSVIQSLKHLCCNACVAFHTCADD